MKSEKSPSRSAMSRKAVGSYMSTTNGGGDPVTALALRPRSSSKSSSADRQARVQREMNASLKKLYKY
ncbi:hypothetical protein PG997_001723 [Apiospora hydei]|uniref:Uncharacterized protein n=1 Tax=Apiospora hydei TaxID=1337664 RepID=A0ABR1XEP9_9PEZI